MSKMEGNTVLHNLPIQTPFFVGREWEIGRIERFLDREMPTTEGQGHCGTIMVVYGPRGVGKTALVRQVGWSYIYRGEDRFRLILWSDREAFASLVSGDSEILPSAAETLSTLKEDWLSEEVSNRLSRFLKPRAFAHEEIEENADFLKKLLRLQPFLLIVDDFDEKDARDSEYLCRQLERISLPNKVILTSRANAFPFSEWVRGCPVGLLNETETSQLFREGFEGIGLRRDLLIGGGLNETAGWLWNVSAGLPEFITWLLRQAAKRELKLGPSNSAIWSGLFTDFTMQYLPLAQDQARDQALTRFFAELSATDKHVLVAMASRSPVVGLDSKALRQMLPYFLDDQVSLVNLRTRRLLCQRAIRDDPDADAKDLGWRWVFLPFMKGFVERQLTDYLNQPFHQERAQHWIRFLIQHKGQHGEIRPCLDHAFDTLAWCFNRQQWELTLELGNLIAQEMADPGQEPGFNKDKYQAVCKMTIHAAEVLGDWDTEIEQRLNLLQSSSQEQDLIDLHNYLAETMERINKNERTGRAIKESTRATISHLYANYMLTRGEGTQAKEWLERAISGFDQQGDKLKAAWVVLDLAELELCLGNLSNAFEEAGKATELVREDGRIEATELQIKAGVIMAHIHFCNGIFEESTALFENALQLAKDLRLQPLVDEMSRYAELLRLLTGNPDPVLMVDTFLRHKFLLGLFQEGVICPGCRNPVRREELFAHKIWLCLRCKDFYHTDHLENTRCPKCGMTYQLVET